MVAEWASLPRKTYLLRLLMHQHIPLLKTSSYTHSKSFVVACVYRTSGSCSSAFLDDFLHFCGFLSSLTSSFIICGDFNVHVDTDCIDQRKFLNLLDMSNLAQNVNKSTHLHGHILDLILSPSDSSFVSNVAVGEMVSDHALMKGHLDFACPAIPKVDSISYRRYHKINMKSFCEDLANTSFVTSPAIMAADLYDQYIRDLGGVLDRHAPLICRRAKKTPAGWLSDSYRRAKSIRCQFERMWRKDRSQLSRSRLRRQISRCNAIINRDKAEAPSLVITAMTQTSYGIHFVMSSIVVRRLLSLLISLRNP